MDAPLDPCDSDIAEAMSAHSSTSNRDENGLTGSAVDYTGAATEALEGLEVLEGLEGLEGLDAADINFDDDDDDNADAIFDDDDIDVTQLTSGAVFAHSGAKAGNSDSDSDSDSDTGGNNESQSDSGDNEDEDAPTQPQIPTKPKKARAKKPLSEEKEALKELKQQQREASKAEKAAAKIAKRNQALIQTLRNREARRIEREKEKKRHRQQQLLGGLEGNTDMQLEASDNDEANPEGTPSRELDSKSKKVLEAELEANRELEAEMTEERRKLIEAQEIDEDEADMRVRRLTNRAMREISESTGLAINEEKSLLRDCRRWMKSVWFQRPSETTNAAASLADREYIEHRLGVEIQKFYGVSDQSAIVNKMNEIHRFLNEESSDEESDGEDGTGTIGAEVSAVTGEGTANVRDANGHSPVEVASVIYFSDSDSESDSAYNLRTGKPCKNDAEAGMHVECLLPTLDGMPDGSKKIGIVHFADPNPASIAPIVTIGHTFTPNVKTPLHGHLHAPAGKTRNDDLREKLAARRKFATSAYAMNSKANSRSGNRAALLLGLRERVAETARVNICISHNMQDVRQLSERNQLTEKCRQLVELFRNEQARQKEERAKMLRVSFKQTADEDDAEFDDGLGATEEILSEEQQRQLRESFSRDYAEMEEDDDEGEYEDEVDVFNDEAAVDEGDAEALPDSEAGNMDHDGVDKDAVANDDSAIASKEGSEADAFERPIKPVKVVKLNASAYPSDSNSPTEPTECIGDNNDSGNIAVIDGADSDDDIVPTSRRSRITTRIDDDDDDDDEAVEGGKGVAKPRMPKSARIETADDDDAAINDSSDGSDGDENDDSDGSDDDDDDKATAAEDSAPVSRNNLFRLQLLEEAQRERREKSRVGAGLIENEAEEDEEQGQQAGLGDFGFTYLTKNDAAEEAAAMILRKGDLDHIVDDVSDGEGDEEAGLRARLDQQDKEDRARTRAVIAAVTEGFAAQKKGGSRRVGLTEDALLADRNEMLLRGEGVDRDGNAGSGAEEELDDEELLQRGLTARREREQKYRNEFEDEDELDLLGEDGLDDGENGLDGEGPEGMSREERERLRRRQLEKRKAIAAKQREFEELLKMRRALRRSQTHSSYPSIGANANSSDALTLAPPAPLPVQPLPTSHATSAGGGLALQLMGAPSNSMSLALDDDDDDGPLHLAPVPLSRTTSMQPISRSSGSGSSAGPGPTSARSNGLQRSFTFDQPVATPNPFQVPITESPRPPLALMSGPTSSSATATAPAPAASSAGLAGVGSGSGLGSSLYRGVLGEAEILGGYGMGMAVPQGRSLRRMPTSDTGAVLPLAGKKRIEPTPVGSFSGGGNIAALVTDVGSSLASVPLRRTFSGVSAAKRRCIAPAAGSGTGLAAATGISLASHAQRFVFTGAEDSQMSNGASFGLSRSASLSRDHSTSEFTDGSSLFAKLQAKTAVHSSGLLKRSSTLRS